MCLNADTGEQRTIDLDAAPLCPVDWSIKRHRKMGSMEWHPEKVELFLSEHQLGTSVMSGRDIKQELEGKDVFNANLLDYLLAHQELIPQEWKGKAIFFWGTEYGHKYSPRLRIRCLYWRYDHWDWLWYAVWPGYQWHAGFPAACRRA